MKSRALVERKKRIGAALMALRIQSDAAAQRRVIQSDPVDVDSPERLARPDRRNGWPASHRTFDGLMFLSVSGFDKRPAAADKVGRVGVVGVQVEFGQIAGVDFQPDILEYKALFAADVSTNVAAPRKSHLFNVGGAKVEVPCGADRGGYGEGAFRAHKSDPLGASQVAGVPHRGIETEKDGVRSGQFDLIVVPGGSQNPDALDGAKAGPDHGDAFFRRVRTGLIQFPVRREFRSVPEQDVHGLPVQVAVPCGDPDRDFEEAVFSALNPPEDFSDDAGDIRRSVAVRGRLPSFAQLAVRAFGSRFECLCHRAFTGQKTGTTPDSRREK